MLTYLIYLQLYQALCFPNSLFPIIIPTLRKNLIKFPEIDIYFRKLYYSLLKLNLLLMKVTVAQDQVKSIVGISCLMFFLGGCVTPVNQGAQSMKCRQAEEAVNSAQKQFDDVILDLAKTPQGKSIKKSVPDKVQSLQEAEEKAYEICSRVY